MDFFLKKSLIILHACASCSELPSNISSLVGCSGYHLIRSFVMVFIELRWETFAGHGIYEHNPHHNSCIQFTVGCSCRLSKKSCPFLYSESLYKNRKDFLRHTVMYLYIVSLETLFFLTLHSIYILLLLHMTLTLTCLCFDLPNDKI